MATTAQQLDVLTASVSDIRRVVFFVGAGISVSAGYPLWQAATEMSLRLATEQGLDKDALAYAEKKLAQGQYYTVFDILNGELTEASFRKLAAAVFGGDNHATDLHRLLVRVPGKGVITTNFDESLASACVLENGGPPVNDMQVAMASDQYFVVKPHGTNLDARTMVLTTADWKRVEGNRDFQELLSWCVNRGQIIFLGYSMRDPDFNSLWDKILRERLFRAPAIYCTQEGAIESERREQFRLKNVQPLEFKDDGSFSFIPQVLNTLIARSVTAVQTVTLGPDKSAHELERYVLLCLEFSPTHRGRLILATKAIALGLLEASKLGVLTCQKLEDEVCAILGQDSESMRAAARAGVEELAAEEYLEVKGKEVIPDKKRIAALVSKANEIQEAEALWARSALAEAETKADVSVAKGDESYVAEILERVMLVAGREIAESFLFSRPQNDELERIDSAVHQFCADARLEDREDLYKRAVRQMVLDPGEEHEDLLFKKLQSYFIASAYILDPNSEKLLSQYARDHWVYFDSSIILPALATGHPSNAVYKRLLNRTQAQGMRLRMIKDMMNEVWANVRTALSAFKEFSQTGIPLLDVLEGYVTMHGPGNGNVFLEGFLNRHRLDNSLSPANYISEVFGSAGFNLTEEKLLAAISNNLGIDADTLEQKEVDSVELSDIANSIAHIRKMGGRFKNQLLCTHEARQFYLIHLRRRQNPPLANKIWFVTTDRFLVELQRLERKKYPLPISYTPRSWFQYLDIIDTESRGSRHFSRLQPRMRFGVVSGQLGIDAIHTILKQRKDLIRRGLVTVKELAEAAVRDFHVQKAIIEYDRRAGSVAQDNPQVKEARDKISGDIERAVGQFVTVRTQEIDQIKSERDGYKNQINTLEKKLAKERYIARVKSGKPQKRKKRRR